MKLRPARLDDAHAVARIHVLAWQTAYQGIVPADYLAGLSIEKREAYWREVIACGTPSLVLAKLEGIVVGWVAFGPCRDEGSSAADGEIWAIYVAPAHWSSGVGKALWSEAQVSLAQGGFKTVSLWVLAENRRAIQFYLAAGFSPEAASLKTFTIAGQLLQEVRYVRALGRE